ncbi:ATP-dependent DNA helicase [Actinomyces viscosus]|uniref:Helicase IV n=1 Tax=Actinomyces viscosus TaxID=1656 RepID=A0A448PJR7_ACTVI|nr:AAA family ATPase [Actinomyces viscosus]TFH54114.1 ATP-dependent DNA helicase [Actinomyces viscosus]VEI15311.1 Helicase IV [Actinomyces viscosus]
MRGFVSQTIPSHPPQSQRETRQRAEDAAQDAAGDNAGSVREREVRGEQEVVDLAYSELDRQLAQARRSLARTEAQGVSGTHQSRGERDAYAVHYSSLVSSLEGVEDRLVFGRMDMSRAPDDAAGSADAGTASGAGSAFSPGSGRGVGSSSPVTDGGRRHYVGRIGLQDAQHREVILDWRAPLARAFYQATASHPMGLVRRRHIDTRTRRVLGVEDEVLDLDALGADGAPEGSSGAAVAAGQLQGEGALIAAMSTARDGRMGDIVATIQAEQDRIVTSSGRGVLVVQGGPGTGKTAVALHRVAYLFYSERERLERSGVLLVGPSRTFLRYVEQVLPSLGETGVVSTTIGDLVPGVRATAQEDARIAEIKGRSLWVKALETAVRGLQRVPEAPREIEVQGVRLRLEPGDVREAGSRARRGGKPHNLARETFVLWLLERLTDQYAAATNQDASDADTRAWIREDIRTARDARREINLCWMPTTPEGLLERLWSRPALLEQVAPSLSERERALLYREPGGALTPADIPLIDELAELLGPSEDAQARRARLEARRREDLVAYAAQAIEAQDLGDGMVSAEMLADRVSQGGPTLTLAERARADRTWTYGHVVVDEAQELGAMAWRALARRCPVRSFTVVGDLAQYSGPHAPDSWGEVLSALGTAAQEPGGRSRSQSRHRARSRSRQGRQSGRSRGGSTPLREEALSVCYRTPATIMEVAEETVTRLGHPPVYPVRSVRDLPDCLEITEVADISAFSDTAENAEAAETTEAAGVWAQALREAVSEESIRLDREVGAGVGRIAVISPSPRRTEALLRQDPDLAAAMEAPGGDVLRSRLLVVSPVLSKGLEFDVVVLVDPADIGERSAGDLYVAMTRPTRRLRVVSRLPLPQGLEARSGSR